jgi:hypothetical protein
MCHSCVKRTGNSVQDNNPANRPRLRRAPPADSATRTLEKGHAGMINVRPDRSLRSQTMTDTPPDRLSVNPRSPHYDAEVLTRDVGIRFNGIEKTNVEEYCVSEGWIRVEAGKSKDRFGNPLTIKLSGKVEPYFRGQPES